MKRRPPYFSLRTVLILLVLTLFSSACSTTKKPQNDRLPNTAPPPTSLDALFERARSTESPQREQFLLLAISQLRKNGESDEAQKILASLFFGALPIHLKAAYIAEYAEIALVNNRPELALNALTSDQFSLYDYFDQLPSNTQIQLSEIKARTYGASGNFIASARERIYFNPLLSATEKSLNEAIIWENLNQLPAPTLQKLAFNTPSSEFRGWLELAHLNKALQHNIDQQYEALNRWLARWENHAGAVNLPKNLELLSKYADLRPKKIALFLPLKGKLSKPAQAIQDGILAAHYTALKSSAEVPEIALYDTSQSNDIKELYQQALTEGADLIIGPLKKQRVNSMLKLALPDVPVLALNYASHFEEGSAQSNAPASNVFQFGLLPEDDAKQVALKAWQDGHRNVAILHPESSWGARVSRAFVDYWQSLGGQVVSDHSFDAKHGFSGPIKKLLNVDQSEQRAKLLKQKLKTPLEFSVRRRKDIDFIFLLATPKQARQIKPTLAFYYAKEIPVYATAQLYEGRANNSERDRDMNGILFCDIPWILEETDQVKSSSLIAWPNHHSRYDRLIALGVDAYRLHSRLAILAAAPSSKIYGATGVLSLSDKNRFQRDLLWAKIISGKARVIHPSNPQPTPKASPFLDKKTSQPSAT